MFNQEYIKSILQYNAQTSFFIWLQNYHKTKIGKKAGSISSRGYVVIVVRGKLYQAHRLAWLYMTGKWPKHFIDHINSSKTDNCWKNIREANDSENQMNRKIGRNNTSGYKRVSFAKNENKWSAAAKLSGKTYYLGLYESPSEASDAYVKFAKEKHGEFFSKDYAQAINGAR